MYNSEEIISNVHTEPGHEERRNKIGCLMTCILKKQNLVSIYKYTILLYNSQMPNNSRIICYNRYSKREREREREISVINNLIIL